MTLVSALLTALLAAGAAMAAPAEEDICSPEAIAKAGGARKEVCEASVRVDKAVAEIDRLLVEKPDTAPRVLAGRKEDPVALVRGLGLRAGRIHASTRICRALPEKKGCDLWLKAFDKKLSVEAARERAAVEALRKKYAGGAILHTFPDEAFGAAEVDPAMADEDAALYIAEGWPTLRCGARKLVAVLNWRRLPMISADTPLQQVSVGGLFLFDAAGRAAVNVSFHADDGAVDRDEFALKLGSTPLSIKTDLASPSVLSLSCGSDPKARLDLKTLYAVQRRSALKGATTKIGGRQWLSLEDPEQLYLWDEATLKSGAYWPSAAPIGVLEAQPGEAKVRR